MRNISPDSLTPGSKHEACTLEPEEACRVGQTVRGLVTLCRTRRADGKVSKYVLQLTQVHRGKDEERNAYEVGSGDPHDLDKMVKRNY